MAANSGKSVQKVSITADCRERQSRTCDWLRSFDAEVVEKQLEVADYIVSDRVGIERKTIDDFLESVINGRIFSQLENLAASFEKPMLIIEGDQKSLFTARKMHPNSVYGALSSIAIDYGVPIIWTHSPQATAAQIYWTGRREQIGKKNGNGGRFCRKVRTVPENQEFLISGLPNVNSKLSKRLLSKFGTAKKVFSASEERLMKVDGLGKKKAKAIWCLLNEKYDADNGNG
jgi:Fanconi anemia group M protein